MKRVAVAALYTGLLLLLTLFGTAVPESIAQDAPPSTVTLIVKMVQGVSPTDAEATIRRYGGTPKSSIAPLRMYVVEVPAELAESITAQLQADPKVERVEEDKSRKLSSTPSDALYSSQWALPKIKWDDVYGTLLPIAQIDVAVLDTGIDAAHPDLIGAIGPGTSFVDSSEGRTDLNGHGTWVSGIVAGRTNNFDGVAGVAYSNVQILPVKVLDAAGEGQDSDIISGIIWAVDRRASVILMAFSNPGFSQNLQDAIDYAWSQGIVLVAAAGNDGSNAAAFPAGDKSVVGVAATDENDALASGSNYGPSIFMAAPGTNILSTYKGGGYVTWSGTSASAAMVAGAAALMRAVDPSLSNGAVVGRLARNADLAGTQDETGNGRLQIARALADTATDEIRPAGAPPVGDGGPFVGPYRAAACTVSGVSVVSQTPPSATAGQTITYSTITLTKSNGNCSGNWSIDWIGGTRAGTGTSFSPATFTGAGTSKTTTLTITTTAGLTPGGTKNFTVSAGGDDTGLPVTSSNFTFTLNKISSTTTVTVADATYDGNPHGGIASVTGDGGLNESLGMTYEGRNATVYGPSSTAPTNAGDYKASASYPGDATYDSSSDTKNFTIAKATSTTTVTCPASVDFDGSAQTPCTATVTGAGGLSLSPTPNYSNNTNAGTASASYTYAGDANHAGSSDSENFTIDPASSTTTVTCPASVAFDGSAQTPCTATVTGAGGLNLTPTPNYSNNTNAGTATASYTYAGDANHAGSSDSENFTIDPATSTTTVICPANVTFDGSAQTPCTATVTGAGGLNLTPTPNYSNNTNAGTATASYTYAGDANHTSSSDTENFTIDPATSTTTVNCPTNVTFDGSAQTPCTATVTGAGGLNLAPTPNYSNNTNAGTATASYAYAGGANHTASSDSKNFTIDPAPSMTTVSCPTNVTFDGSAQTPCTATVTGAGGLNLTPTPNYSNNTNAGTATASYTYAGDANHTGSSDSENFTISPALANIILSNLVQGFTGGPLQPNVTTTPSGLGYTLTFGSSAAVSSTPGSTIVPSAPGVYTVLATIANPNYMPVTDTALFVIYDPSGGFVTGGGWINSPVGACRFDACTNDTVGKANFGFNSKYQKGTTRPTGNTEFQFQAGGLNFKSTDYEWLVVSGTTKAQFKGSGTINGSGNYGFILTAIDGNNFGLVKPDAFRIKIWNMNDGGVVYDNQMGKAENSDDATILGNNGQGGGSIVIHDTKK